MSVATGASAARDEHLAAVMLEETEDGLALHSEDSGRVETLPTSLNLPTKYVAS